MKNHSFYFSFIVEKCSVDVTCDASALCRNPKAVGGDVECYCDSGLQFGSDGRTCTSTAEAEKHCPTSECWTYETDSQSGEKKCVLKLRVLHIIKISLSIILQFFYFNFNVTIKVTFLITTIFKR